MKFKPWLIETTLMTKKANDPPVNPPDDDGHDGDDNFWNRNYIHRTYGMKLAKWVNSSPCAKKIVSKIIEMVFKTKPKTDGWNVHSKNGLEVGETGDVGIHYRWILPYDKFDNKLYNTLRNSNKCDLWKPFDHKPEEMWNLIDKGDVYEYVFEVIVKAIVGSTHLDQQGYLFQKVAQTSPLLTLQKYTEFIAHSMREEQEKEAKEEVLDQYKMDGGIAESVNLSNYNVIPRSQIYGGNLMGEITFNWDYKIDN